MWMHSMQISLLWFSVLYLVFWNIRMNTPRESNRDTKFDGFISFPKIGFVRGWTTTWNVHIVFIKRHVCRALPVDIFNYIHLNFGQIFFYSRRFCCFIHWNNLRLHRFQMLAVQLPFMLLVHILVWLYRWCCDRKVRKMARTQTKDHPTYRIYSQWSAPYFCGYFGQASTRHC